MKLTENDLIFLQTLKQLLEHKNLHVEYRPGYLRLRQNYGDHIESTFRMTRQGVRWRFQRVMEMYISAFQTILTVERILGAELRDLAIQVSRERYQDRDATVHSPDPQDPDAQPDVNPGLGMFPEEKTEGMGVKRG